MIRLAECTWPMAGRLARDERALVILPLGAVEQHGPHLPLLVDWLGAEELARRLAPHLTRAGYRVVLAPSLPYGASPLAERWPGTVSLSRGTLVRLIVEVIRSLARPGFRRFVLANYQADPGHLAAMAEARRRLAGLQVLFAGFSPDLGYADRRAEPAQGRVARDASVASPMVNPRVSALMRSPRPEFEWHAGELETALVLARRPDLVRRGIMRRLSPTWVDFRAALARGARRFEDIAPGGAGYFGWPAAARARTAERAMRLRAGLIARALIADLRKDTAARRRPARDGRRAPDPGAERAAQGRASRPRG